MIALNPDIFAAIYLLATVLFIFGLKGLSHPRTALAGNIAAMVGMGIAIAITLRHPEVSSFGVIAATIIIGAVIGAIVALRISMKSMPELVAILHSFVGLSAVLVGVGTYIGPHHGEILSAVLAAELSLGAIIGAITFTGSLVAFGKLSTLISSQPLKYWGQHLVNFILLLLTGWLVWHFTQSPTLTLLLCMIGVALLLGVLLVMPIGGGDMPVVVSMLNSYSGWAASATGFTLGNNLLIATGALVGSSGAILSYIMCKAMNRSFVSVILGGYGATADSGASAQSSTGKHVKSASAEDIAYLLENAAKVIIIPGYGMAVAQAQHAIKELFHKLSDKGIEVKFAIHPVAGRMPGHMNVLLAEADVPYDHVFEMDEINAEFPACDVVLVVGANDIVNPAAKTDKSSPLYGMPILEVHRAKQVVMIKRSMKAGYAGVDNNLFYYDNCTLLFGDAKSVCEHLVGATK